MARKFGMISTSIWSSKRFKSLDGNAAKLVYFYLHTNRHGNSIGVYQIPVDYFTADLKMDSDDVKGAMQKISDAGLAEYDADEEVIRIVGWFTHNPLTNRKHLMGAVNAFNDLPTDSKLRPVVALEIAYSMVSRIKLWSNEPKIHEAKAEVVEILSELLTKTRASVGNKAFDEIFIDLSIDLRIALSIALPIGLPIVRQIQETEMETEIETETNTETDTGKSPKKNVQDGVADLNAKAKKERQK